MKWFKHQTDAHRNRKIRKVLRVHGVTGYGIWFALLERLYEREGSFQINADELWLEDFADDLKITDYRTLVRVFDTFAEVGLISRQLWEEHVIYCESIIQEGDTYTQKKALNAERQARFREKHKPEKKEKSRVSNALRNAESNDVTLSEIRDQIQRSDTDSEQEKDQETENPIEEKEKTRACKKVDRPSSKKIELPEQEELPPSVKERTIDHSTNPEGPGGAAAVVHEFVEAELVEDEEPVVQPQAKAVAIVSSGRYKHPCERMNHALTCGARQDSEYMRFWDVYGRLGSVVSNRPAAYGDKQEAESEWMALRQWLRVEKKDTPEYWAEFWAGMDAFSEQATAASDAKGEMFGFKGAAKFLRDRDWVDALQTKHYQEQIAASGLKRKSEKSKAEIAAEERAASSARVYAKLKAEGRCR